MSERALTNSSSSRLGASSAARIEEERPRTTSVVLVVSGDADLHLAPELRDRLAEAITDGARHIVVDLSAVTFIDSMALGVLLGARNRLREAGGHLRLVVPASDVRRIFELSLLDQVFALDSTRDEALTSLVDSGPA
jgi:anti-sigma B factor antagonist